MAESPAAIQTAELVGGLDPKLEEMLKTEMSKPVNHLCPPQTLPDAHLCIAHINTQDRVPMVQKLYAVRMLMGLIIHTLTLVLVPPFMHWAISCTTKEMAMRILL